MARFIPTPDDKAEFYTNAIHYPHSVNVDAVNYFFIAESADENKLPVFNVCAGTNQFNSVIRAGFKTYDEAKSFLDDLVIKINFDTPF